MEDDFDFLIKIVLIGDTSVGKSNLLSRYIHDGFDEESKSTIGVDFAAKHLSIRDKNVKIQIWDTAGQEKFRSIIKSYYSNANGFVIVYDVTKQDSFEHVNNWIKILEDNAAKNHKMLLIGNKIDLEEDREVSPIDGKDMAEKHGSYFMETSAKTNENDCVSKAFQVLIESIFDDLEQQEDKMIEEGINAIYRSSMHKISFAAPTKQTSSRSCCSK